MILGRSSNLHHCLPARNGILVLALRWSRCPAGMCSVFLFASSAIRSKHLPNSDRWNPVEPSPEHQNSWSILMSLRTHHAINKHWPICQILVTTYIIYLLWENLSSPQCHSSSTALTSTKEASGTTRALPVLWPRLVASRASRRQKRRFWMFRRQLTYALPVVDQWTCLNLFNHLWADMFRHVGLL